MKNEKICFDMGNRAIAEGAFAAGASFFAGYPITPSTEIAEIASERLPQGGGKYIQMEDELSSIAAVIGASSTGKKAFTATSGPGFSLMQENIGVAVNAEIPCVIIDVQRSGPSTGIATKAAQGDVLQARFGTHGDSERIALAPASVQDCYDFTIEAFNLAEKYRTPVILLADKYIGHLRESFTMWKPSAEQLYTRRRPVCSQSEYLPHGFTKYPDEVAEIAPFGDEKYITRITTTTHNEKGAACTTPENTTKFLNHYMDKIQHNLDDIVKTRSFLIDDAEYAIIAYGCSVRSALGAMEEGRKEGLRIGVLQMVTVWPFPDKLIADVCRRVKAVVVPELNYGQYIREIDRVSKSDTPIIGVNHLDSTIITPEEIIAVIKEVGK